MIDEQENDKIETIDVTELVEDSDIFESKGFSFLKITQGRKVRKLKIPIKSSGVAELIDEYNEHAPKPPTISKVIYPNTPIAKELGITKKQHVKTFDLTDSDYVKKKEKHDSDLGIKIVLKGLDLVLKYKSDDVIESEDDKVKVLMKLGMSGSHFSQLVNDITNLTKWQEEQETDFLQE